MIAVRRFPEGARGDPARAEKVERAKKEVDSSPFFEHLEQEFGRQVISAQTCASYEPATAGERWYCAKTQPNMDFVTLVHLAGMGFATHVALFVERTARNPSGKGGVRRGTPVLRRCFPGYIFVALDFQTGHWPNVKKARGFNSLLSKENGRPVPMSWFDMFELLQFSGNELAKLQQSREAAAHQRTLRAAEAAKPVRRRVWVNMADMGAAERVKLLHEVMARRFDSDECPLVVA